MTDPLPQPGRMRMPRILSETQDAIAEAVQVMAKQRAPHSALSQMAQEARVAAQQGEPQRPIPAPVTFEQAVWYECENIARMLIEKNRQYGNSALNPVRIFSDAHPMDQLFVRVDDKLSRIKHGNFGDIGSAEDTIADIIGYLILIRIQHNGFKA